jgi:hypothetical protein
MAPAQAGGLCKCGNQAWPSREALAQPVQREAFAVDRLG